MKQRVQELMRTSKGRALGEGEPEAPSASSASASSASASPTPRRGRNRRKSRVAKQQPREMSPVINPMLGPYSRPSPEPGRGGFSDANGLKQASGRNNARKNDSNNRASEDQQLPGFSWARPKVRLKIARRNSIV